MNAVRSCAGCRSFPKPLSALRKDSQERSQPCYRRLQEALTLGTYLAEKRITFFCSDQKHGPRVSTELANAHLGPCALQRVSYNPSSSLIFFLHHSGFFGLDQVQYLYSIVQLLLRGHSSHFRFGYLIFAALCHPFELCL